MGEQMSDLPLSSGARRHLRSLAHPLRPVVQIGTEGLKDSLCHAVSTALEVHELIKVKLGRGFSGARESAARDLSAATDSHVVQIIGRVVVLYRRREREDPSRPRIELPQ